MNIILTLALLSVFASIIPIRGTDVWYPQFIAVVCVGCLALSLNIYKVSKSLGIFFAYCVYSAVFVSNFNALAMVELLATAMAGILFLEASKLDSKKRAILYNVMIAMLVVQILWCFVQKLNLDPIFKSIHSSRACDTVGFSGSHNQISLFISALSPLLFSNIFTIILALIGIILTTSISGGIGIFGALMFYYRSNKLILTFCVILLAAFYLIFCFINKKGYGGEFNERIDLWKLSAQQVFNGKALMQISPNVSQVKTCNPLFGFGMASFFQVSPYTQSEIIAKNSHGAHRYEHAHNDYIEILFDFGYVGMCGFMFFIYEIFIKLRKIKWNKEVNVLVSMVICIAICAISIYTIHTAYSGMLVAIILGLLFSKLKESSA